MLNEPSTGCKILTTQNGPSKNCKIRSIGSTTTRTTTIRTTSYYITTFKLIDRDARGENIIVMSLKSRNI